MSVFLRWVSVLVVILAAGCSGFEDDFCRDEPTTAPDYAAFELPPEVVNLEARCSRWMDHTTINVRFEMQPEHLETFQAGTLIEQWETSVDPSKFEQFSLLNRRDHLTSYLYGETSEQLLASGTQQVLIDTTNPELYVVYVTYFVSY